MKFQKFQANGNDFILINEFVESSNLNSGNIKKLCDRHYGIGADGIMLLKPSDEYDFEMLFFNSDGNKAEMCGNGGRCIAAMAFIEKIAREKMCFNAPDGVHNAVIEKEIIPLIKYYIALKMVDVNKIEKFNGYYFLNTGVPHYVEFVHDIDKLNVFERGRSIRFDKQFGPKGTNANFVEIRDDEIFVRTYERGVENETLSCGTGVTAAAIASFIEFGKKDLIIKTNGGDFRVDFDQKEHGFSNIWLKGPAEKIFTGETIFL